MNNANHALGPWEVGEDDSINGCPFIPIMAADGGCIAEVVPDYSEDHPHLGKIERATGRLIAAAPERLEAMEEARSGLVAHTGGVDGACGETIARIDAALTKARGE